MALRLSPRSLFHSYLSELRTIQERAGGKQINNLPYDLYLRDWNLYFFSKQGTEKYNCSVYCNKFDRHKKVKKDLGNKYIGKEYLWDLCWFRENPDSLELVLEQECNSVLSGREKDEYSDAWQDFSKIMFACAKSIRVFIGRSIPKNFDNVAEACADYYCKTTCCKENRGFLLILIHQARTEIGDMKIGGWELTKDGRAILLKKENSINYSGWF